MRTLWKPWSAISRNSSGVMGGLPHAVSSAPTASRELPRFQPGCIAATTSAAESTLGEGRCAAAAGAAAAGAPRAAVRARAAATAVRVVQRVRVTRVLLQAGGVVAPGVPGPWTCPCLLYTSDAADDLLCVDLG